MTCVPFIFPFYSRKHALIINLIANLITSHIANYLQAEREIQTCQVEFDRQVEVTRVLMEGLGAAHNKHVELLGKYVESQISYYNKCQSIITDLQQDLSSSLPLTSTGNKQFYVKSVDVVAPGDSSSPTVVNNGATNQVTSSTNGQSSSAKDSQSGQQEKLITDLEDIKVMKARVVCDFNPTKSDEMAVSTAEILSVTRLPSDPDWMLCVKDSDAKKRGKVPLAYLEILN